MVYDAQDNFMGDIPPAEVFERTRTEEINGANSLKLSTVHPIEVGNRLLTCDATGTWREYVVTGIEQGHTDGLAAYCTYYAVWSIQYDLTGVTCDVMPGVKSPVSARAALVALLGNTSQWAVGNVDVGTTGGASMWQRSAWEAMSTLIEVWGGEIAPRIEVDNNGVVSRLVDYRARVGASKVTRRFDYGADLADIKRKVADTVRYCRIVPLGAGSTDAVASADRKRVTIKSVNDGVEWLQNDSVVPIVRRPNGSGGWEYPTKFVIFDGVEDPQTLKDTALRALEEYTTPKVSYTAKVTQFAQAGVDLHGVAVGDAVDVVDKEFGVEGGLRLTSRIVKLVTDELQPENVTVTLGNVTTDLSSRFAKLDNKVARVSQALANQEGGTWEYLNAIVDNLNAAINATGGYTYITEGQGIRTYDRAVSDPLVGTEASKVVEVKGGSIRIADSKTSQGEWNWRTVFVSGHVAADLITAVAITAGFIGSSTSGNWWNLDTGTLYIGGKAAPTAIDDASKVATNYLTYSSSNGLDVGYSGTSAKTRVNGSGVNIYDGNGASTLYAGLSSGNTIVRVGKTASPHATVNADGMTVYSGSESSGNIVAQFGADGAQIGRTLRSSYIKMDYHSMQLIDTAKRTYFYVSDLLDNSGKAPIQDSFVGDGTTKTFSFSMQRDDTEGLTVTVNGSAVQYSSANTASVTLASAPAKKAIVVVSYTTDSPYAKAYTLGMRKSGSNVGAMSVATGYENTASGAYSAAFGTHNVTSGERSFAAGYNNKVQGRSSFACGLNSTITGDYAFTCGQHLTAGNSQAVFGHYNAEEPTASFIIGVGSASSRRNIFWTTNDDVIYLNASSTYLTGRVHITSSKTPVFSDEARTQWRLALGIGN